MTSSSTTEGVTSLRVQGKELPMAFLLPTCSQPAAVALLVRVGAAVLLTRLPLGRCSE